MGSNHMEKPNMLVTGDPVSMNRYGFFLSDSLKEHFSVDLCPISNPFKRSPYGLLMFLIGELTCRRPEDKRLKWSRLLASRYAFLARSRHAERIIRRRKRKPDYIFHIFSMFAPFAAAPWVPYVMWLDYTMALSHRNYKPWAPFRTDQDREAWLACERRAYGNAHHVFTWSEVTRQSVIQDYGVAPDRVTVAGAAGCFHGLYQGEKTFGSMRCLFQGSQFIRKGGDLLLQAWPMVRKSLPNAKLVIVGDRTGVTMDGIENVGYVKSREHMKELFLTSDLVVAPGRCDPFQTFLLEAMNFGVPCIVSDRDGMPEIVADGETGTILKRLDASNIATAVVSLLSDPARLLLLSKNARKAVRLRLNWDVIARKVTNVLMGIS